MLKRLLANKILKTIQAEDILRNRGNCIDSLGKGRGCGICEGICQEAAIKNAEIDFDKCVGCSICSTACPTQTILPPKSVIEAVISHVQQDHVDICVSCSNSSSNGEINLICMASIPWEYYVLLSKNRKIIFSTGKCGGCKYDKFINLRIKEIKEHVGEEYYEAHFMIDSAAALNISRRRAAKSILSKGQSLVKQTVTERDNNNKGLFYRRTLKEYLSKYQERYRAGDLCIRWKIPQFNDDCWGCGLCTHVCPNQALVMVDKRMYFIPWRCTECNHCKAYCPENGINGWRTLKVDLSQKAFIQIEPHARYCKKCGSAMKLTGKKPICRNCGYTEKHDSEI